MITVDCTDVESKKSELLVYVSDMIPAMPTLKKNGFVLSPINDEIIEKSKVVTAIKDYLGTIGERENFAVISINDTLVVKSISGNKTMTESLASPNAFFSCPHCGFSTRYEGELNIHQKIHYI
jgi:hypothetical protein